MNIFEKLNKIQTELKAPKKQYSKFGKYNYRSCEDILEGLKPLLQSTNTCIVVNDELTIIGDRYYIKATVKLYDTEKVGDFIEATGYAREEENKKGMDGSQVTGASSSYARKYALNGLFAIDDNKDSDATNKGKEFNEEDKPKQELSNAQIKRLYTISRSKGITEEQVKEVIKKTYNKDSTKDLNKKEYDEIVARMEAKEDKK